MPHPFRAADLSLVGLLVALAGCANSPVSQSTPTMAPTASFAAADHGDTNAPVPLRTVASEYPTAMQRIGNSGVVNVNCLVDENGRVQEANVRDTTDNAFNHAALAAVRQWTFQPARRDGLALPARINIPIKFTFHDR